jgi:hypothetical protein
MPLEKEAAARTLTAHLKTGGAFSDSVFAALAEKNQEIANWPVCGQRRPARAPRD